MRTLWTSSGHEWPALFRKAAAGLLLVLVGCHERSVVALAPTRVRLMVTANVLAVGERLDVAVWYLRGGTARVPIATAQFPLAGAGVQQLPLQLDITECLADPQRAGGVTADCPIVADLLLRDAGGALLDSTTVGPVNVGSGATVSAPAATLQAPAAIAVVSGDQQLGWLGRELLSPVVVRLTDRAGNAIRNRTLAVTTVSGGGASVAASVTDTGGRAAVRYALGVAPGAQQFRITVQGLPAVAATLNVVAIRQQAYTISVGQFTACSTAPGGSKCWGDNSVGVVGNPAVVADTSLPVPVAAGSFAAIDVNVAANGSYHACAIDGAGAPWCWGANRNGELGVPVTDNNCPAFGRTLTCSRTPQPVATSVRLATISADGNDVSPTPFETRACGASITGAAYCWGFGPRGELGLGAAVTTTTVPTLVDSTRRWLHVATGGQSTCGLTNQGEIYCWGANLRGDLGDGTTTSSATPVRVSSTERFMAVDVGFLHTCALNLSGDVFCWGRDWSSTVARNVLVPTRLAGMPPMARISSGALYDLGVTPAGELWCWGRNFDACGDGYYPSSPGPSPVHVSAPVPFIEVAAGADNSCARAVSGDVYCWGGLLSVVGVGVSGNVGGCIGCLGMGIFTPAKVNFTGSPRGPAAAMVRNGPLTGPTAAVLSTVNGPSSSVLFNPYARVVDANGLPVSGQTVSGSIVSGSGQLFNGATPISSWTTTSLADGSVPMPPGGFRWKMGATPGPNVVRLTAQGIGTIDYSVPAVTAGQPDSIVPVVGPGQQLSLNMVVGSAQAGISGTAQVRVRDASGLPVRNTPVTLQPITNGISVVGSPTSISDDDGVAAFAIAADTIIRVNASNVFGNFRIDSVAFHVGTSGPVAQYMVQSNGGPVTGIAFIVPPSQVKAGSTITPAIEVAKRDRFGNLTTGAGAVQLQLVGSGGVLGGTTSLGATDARFMVLRFTNITISQAGTYQLRATFQTFQVLSAPFQVVP